MEERIQRTMSALERNNMKAYYAESRDELFDIVRGLVKNDKLITAGGSVTLEESGVKQLLMTEFKGVYLDRSEGKTPEEVEDILHKAFVSDKASDNDYYLLTLMGAAKELRRAGIFEADVYLAAGLPLTWVKSQRREFTNYLMRNERVEFEFNDRLYKLRFVGCSVFPQGYTVNCQVKCNT